MSVEACFPPILRFHPPSVVGVMGSAAASAKLLGLSPAQCVHALAIATSSAGAPLANAATQTKPLHIGNATRGGLEAAQLAQMGLEGNPSILDMDSGFGVYYKDYHPSAMADPISSEFKWILESQDVAFKTIPAHLGMHWVVEAATTARAKLENTVGTFDLDQIRKVTLRVPPSKYIDCPFPSTEHQARHSFQFNACSALLDNKVTVSSYCDADRNRPALRKLLTKVKVETPEGNQPSFDKMYCETEVETEQGLKFLARCDTFYGHWRKPLSQQDLVQKFRAHASSVLSTEGVDGVTDLVGNIEKVKNSSKLGLYLRMTSSQHEQPHSPRENV